jgi:hypothetical protein
MAAMGWNIPASVRSSIWSRRSASTVTGELKTPHARQRHSGERSITATP